MTVFSYTITCTKHMTLTPDHTPPVVSTLTASNMCVNYLFSMHHTQGVHNNPALTFTYHTCTTLKYRSSKAVSLYPLPNRITLKGIKHTDLLSWHQPKVRRTYDSTIMYVFSKSNALMKSKPLFWLHIVNTKNEGNRIYSSQLISKQKEAMIRMI